MKPNIHQQQGVSLIEVLVAILILSFGMLALGSMLAYAVQLPKLAGYRSTATLLAASHIERLRANQAGFAAGNYDLALSYDGTSAVPSISSPCTYPACTSSSLATQDTQETGQALRQQLPAGGMRVARATIGGFASANEGDLWIVWDEPNNLAKFASTGSDNCPSQVTDTYNSPRPRCLYVRFAL